MRASVFMSSLSYYEERETSAFVVSGAQVVSACGLKCDMDVLFTSIERVNQGQKKIKRTLK